jgi:TonB family protein
MRAPTLSLLLALTVALAAMPLHAQDTVPPTAPAPDPTISPLLGVGGRVLPPQATHMVDPQFSEQARAAKLSGIVLVNLIVDTNGMPRNVRVLRGVGMGLDEAAVESVKQYTFRPATMDGKPVAVLINVEVNFQILPKILHSVPLEPTDEARKNHVSGTVMVALTIDPEGNPQNVHAVRGVGMGMDERAVEAAKQYRFEPTLDENGLPIPQTITLPLKFNAANPGDPAADSTIAPMHRIGPRVTSPTLLTKVDPQLSEEARKAKFTGVVLVNLIVDARGMPQNVHILHGVGMGLDENAVAAVKQYTFKPATEGGKPVPVELNVEVSFEHAR